MFFCVSTGIGGPPHLSSIYPTSENVPHPMVDPTEVKVACWSLTSVCIISGFQPSLILHQMCCIPASVVWFWKCTTIATTGKLVVVWRYDSPANSRHELLLIILICYNMHFTGEPRDNQSVLDHSVPGDLSLSDSRHRPHWEPPQVEPRSRPPTSSPPIDLSNQCTFFSFFWEQTRKSSLQEMKENNHQVRTKGHHPRGLGAATPMYFYFEESPEMGEKLWTKLTVFQSLKNAYSRQEVSKKSTIAIWISAVTFLLGADSQV